MSTIGTTTFIEDGNMNYMLLNSNDQYLRKLDFTMNDVTEIQIGVLYTVDSAIGYTGSLWVGIVPSAGGNLGLKDGVLNLKRMIGCHAGGAFGGAGTRFLIPGKHTYVADAPSGSYFTIGANGTYIVSGSARQAGGSLVTVRPIPTNEAPNRKGLFLFSLNRASATTYAARFGLVTNYTSSVGSNHNFTNNTLFSALEYPGSTTTVVIDSFQGTRDSSILETHTAADETNFPLDMVNVYWTGSVPVRIYQIAVTVIR